MASPYLTVYLHPPSTFTPCIDFPPTFAEQILRLRSIIGRPSLLVPPHGEMKKKPYTTVNSECDNNKLERSIVEDEEEGESVSRA